MSIATSSGSPNDAKQHFTTPEEQISYLKGKIYEVQTELSEFQESSRELEVEYETQIKQLETRNKEIQNKYARLEAENDLLKNKYSIYVNDTQLKLNDYQKQISDLTVTNTRLSNYVRELEQTNDDLERARRALAASLETFEGQLNHQIERNVLLENEVSEKEELECVVQRLKEEARDLRHELVAKRNSSDRVTVPSNQKLTPTVTKTDQATSPHSPTRLPPSIVISPTSRLSALSIVSDLLKKVVSLESKLTTEKKLAS